MKKLFPLAVICALAMLASGCGTVTNAAVAGYEGNIATDQAAAGQNVLKAKVWALCLTPFSDIVNGSPQQRAAIKAGCTPSTASTEATGMIEALPAAIPVVTGAPK